jgi:hypothetical protein
MFQRVMLDHLKPGLCLEMIWDPHYDRCTVYVKQHDIQTREKYGVGVHVYGIQQMELISKGEHAPKIQGSSLVFATQEAGWFSIDLGRLEKVPEACPFPIDQDVFVRTVIPPLSAEHIKVEVQLAPDPVGEKGVDGPPGPTDPTSL